MERNLCLKVTHVSEPKVDISQLLTVIQIFLMLQKERDFSQQHHALVLKHNIVKLLLYPCIKMLLLSMPGIYIYVTSTNSMFKFSAVCFMGDSGLVLKNSPLPFVFQNLASVKLCILSPIIS